MRLFRCIYIFFRFKRSLYVSSCKKAFKSIILTFRCVERHGKMYSKRNTFLCYLCLRWKALITLWRWSSLRVTFVVGGVSFKTLLERHNHILLIQLYNFVDNKHLLILFTGSSCFRSYFFVSTSILCIFHIFLFPTASRLGCNRSFIQDFPLLWVHLIPF